MTRWREEVHTPGLLEICMQSSGDMTIKRVRVVYTWTDGKVYDGECKDCKIYSRGIFLG